MVLQFRRYPSLVILLGLCFLYLQPVFKAHRFGVVAQLARVARHGILRHPSLYLPLHVGGSTLQLRTLQPLLLGIHTVFGGYLTSGHHASRASHRKTPSHTPSHVYI